MAHQRQPLAGTAGPGNLARAMAVAGNGGASRQQARLFCHGPRSAGPHRRSDRTRQANRAVLAQAHLGTALGRTNEGHCTRPGPRARPPYPRPLRGRVKASPANNGERVGFAELQKQRDSNAAALGIDPTLIASRGMLSTSP